MIKHFGSLYAGHVDLGDLGLGATAVNDRRFDNNHLITIFDRVERIAKVMDDLDYHSFWMAETSPPMSRSLRGRPGGRPGR